MWHLVTNPISSAGIVRCRLSLRELTSLCLAKPALSSSPDIRMDSPDAHHHQNVVVMRHGDRLDNCDPLWLSTASRPWDPPLADPGKVRAFCTGRRLRTELGFPIHRVLVSPFLRCVQTASEVISALCAIDDDPANMTGDGVAIDPSKLKILVGEPHGFRINIYLQAAPAGTGHVLIQHLCLVLLIQASIEFGLCEMMSREAIRLELAPKDGNWGFNVSELEAMLPPGTVDPTFERVYQELPQYEEGVSQSRTRYEKVIQALAHKFPSENLLLVTHGEGVGVSVSAFMKETTVYEVNYCAFSHSRRPIFFGKDQTFTAGSFQGLTKQGRTGIGYYPLSSITDPA